MRRAGLSLSKRLWLIAMPLLLAGMTYAHAAQLDPESETFYQMVRHFLTRNETRVFRRLATPELRQDFIHAFWEIRDPDPATGENEFRDEVETRFEFITSHFREANRDGWNTARGMIYLVLGPPSSQDEISTLNHPLGYQVSSGTIRWYYGELGFYVQFIDRQGFGVYELDMENTPLILMDYLKTGKNKLLTGSEKEIASRYLKFTVAADPKQNRVTVSVAMRDLVFEPGPDNQQVARLHIAFNLYMADETIASNSEERRLNVSAQELKDGRLKFAIMVPLQKGRNRLDLLVSDRVGGKMNRQMFSLKIK
jgi:GWxTD domain-containing protein